MPNTLQKLFEGHPAETRGHMRRLEERLEARGA